MIGPQTLISWNVAQEDLRYISEHWLSFFSPPPLHNYILGFIYFIFFIMAIVGNGLVIWVFSTSKTLQTPSNIFVVNLAIFDFCMMAKTPIMIYNSFNLGFASGIMWCKVFAFVGSVTGIGAAASNVCIAYDRYRTISRPMDKKMGKGKAILMVLLIWLYALPWAILPFMDIWGRFVPEGFLTTCTFDFLSDDPTNKSFVATLFFFSYVLPMSFIIMFYSGIVKHVFAHEKSLREQAKKMNVQSLRSNAANETSVEIRIAKTAIMICFLFVASWTPYGVIALIGSFGNRSLITPVVSMIPACTCKLVACLDPYVYAISHPKYRMELQKKLPCLTGCLTEKPINEGSSQLTETSSAATGTQT